MIKRNESLRRMSVVSAIGILTLAVASSAQSAVLVSTGNNIDRFLGNVAIGYDFTVGASPVTINSLGFYDSGQNGLAEAHEVGIWLTSGGPALRTVTVPAGSSARLDDVFRYVAVSDLTLSASTSYTIGARYATAADAFNDTDVSVGGNGLPAYSLGGGIASDEVNRFVSPAATLIQPTSDGAGVIGRWAGGNAESFATDTTGAPLLTNTGGGTDRNNYTGSIGYEFTVDHDTVVTSLGFYDKDGLGLARTHQVGLFASTFDGGGEIVRTTVESGTTSYLEGDWRYVDLIQEVVLEAGKTYWLMAEVFNADGDVWLNDNAALPGLSSPLSDHLVFGNPREGPLNPAVFAAVVLVLRQIADPSRAYGRHPISKDSWPLFLNRRPLRLPH